ncbi:MAG: hypothetical protein HQK55_16175 [Deltaproteobacteria bacterium]|nr:hypothetical protein [Deltaproteobacteria bacterium]
MEPHLWGLILHALTDAAATDGPWQKKRGGLDAFKLFLLNDLLGELNRQQAAINHAPKLISGGDLLNAFNLKPSPLIGQLLAAVAEAQALGQVSTSEEALTFAASLIPSRQIL